METTFIYALCDPDTEIVRYVGKSNHPKDRYFRHLKDKQKTYKVNWINKLKSIGKLPVLKILEKINKNQWEEAEKKWIAYYRQIAGHKLTNIDEGGIGPDMTEETKKKISKSKKGKPGTRKGSHQSVETKLKLAEVTRNYFSNPETRKKQAENTKNYFATNLEARRNKAISCKKQWEDPTGREKILNARKNLTLSESHRINISKSLKKYYSSNPSSPEARKNISKRAKKQWEQMRAINSKTLQPIKDLMNTALKV